MFKHFYYMWYSYQLKILENSYCLLTFSLILEYLSELQNLKHMPINTNSNQHITYTQNSYELLLLSLHLYIIIYIRKEGVSWSLDLETTSSKLFKLYYFNSFISCWFYIRNLWCCLWETKQKSRWINKPDQDNRSQTLMDWGSIYPTNNMRSKFILTYCRDESLTSSPTHSSLSSKLHIWIFPKLK